MFWFNDALRRKKHCRMLVTCKHGLPAFSGVLVVISKISLAYHDVKLIGNDVAPAEGVVWIDRENIAYQQEVISVSV